MGHLRVSARLAGVNPSARPSGRRSGEGVRRGGTADDQYARSFCRPRRRSSTSRTVDQSRPLPVASRLARRRRAAAHRCVTKAK